jgi:hypothetical protein
MGLNVVQESAGFLGGCKLLILERETGVEPATSSLGNYASFVNKRLMRSTGWFLAT